MTTLDVNNKDQVTSPQVLDVFLGTPQRHLLIFTGIAMPGLGSSDDELNRDRVVVKLGRTVAQIPADGEWSAIVGLASIGNTESDFIFATDAVSIDVDEKGQLELICDIAVQGDDSGLNRFSYQLNALLQEVEPRLESLLLSTLQPSRGTFDQPPRPPDYAPNVAIAVGSSWGGRVTLTSPASGPGVFVELSTSLPVVAKPPISVAILGGERSGEFLGDAVGFVSQNTDVTITASLNAVYKTAVLTVMTPPR